MSIAERARGPMRRRASAIAPAKHVYQGGGCPERDRQWVQRRCRKGSRERSRRSPDLLGRLEAEPRADTLTNIKEFSC